MNNGTKTILLALSLALGMASLALSPVAAQAAKLGPTDSGAPAAMLMYPVGNKPDSTGTGMKPVLFNHAVHETKGKDCNTCHHTGDPVPCSTCHTLEGKPEGGNVTLERAMHATHIAKREKGQTPTSCVSCHNGVIHKKQRCAGCHAIVPAVRNDAWCASCHTGSPSLGKEQVIAGANRKLDFETNERLAGEAIDARKPVASLGGADGPYKVTIGSISQDYMPNEFAHRRHVESLVRKIGKNKLAQAFHNQPATVCAACHHQSPATATPSKCSSCHTPNPDPATPERPSLKAAYHLQCMGCHTAMDVKRPRNNDCASCHKQRSE